ncbi:acyltransferase family protein [Rhodococcus sovatensis]|uniref:Acyltransferase family protein n=1 Tax=Rhodococcus sovatensis TaxID=1805840 RepID=A0ABZ2PIA8_9NOCA
MNIDSSAPARVDWIDVARGLCIALVVLLHTVNFMATRGLADAWWFDINAVLEPIRMPLFFVVAGLFATRDLELSWNQLWRKRIAPLLYLYVLWMLLRFALFSVFPHISGTHEASSAMNLLYGLINPSSGLWFLYALIVYAVVARTFRRVDPRLQLAAATALSILGPATIEAVSWTWVKIVSYLLFFLVGLHLRAVVHGVAAATTTKSAILWPAAFVSFYFVVSSTTQATAVAALVSVVGVITGVVVCTHIQHWRSSALLRRLGSLTLPIYLLHEIVLGTVITASVAFGLDVTIHGAGPVMITALTICLSVLAGTVIYRWTYLLQLPQWQPSVERTP